MTVEKKQIDKKTIEIDDKVSANIYKNKVGFLLKIELVLNSSQKNIWNIFPSQFTNNKNVNSDRHLYKLINEDYRWLWYWQKMWELWLKEWWIIPQLEYSSKPSSIFFLLKNWYEIIWYFKFNWNNKEFVNFKNIDEKNNFLNSIKINRELMEPQLENVYLFKK